jgi:hypothetical protein
MGAGKISLANVGNGWGEERPMEILDTPKLARKAARFMIRTSHLGQFSSYMYGFHHSS